MILVLSWFPLCISTASVSFCRDPLKLEGPGPLQAVHREVGQRDGDLAPTSLPGNGPTVTQESDLAGGRGLHCSNGGHVAGRPLQ